MLSMKPTGQSRKSTCPRTPTSPPSSLEETTSALGPLGRHYKLRRRLAKNCQQEPHPTVAGRNGRHLAEILRVECDSAVGRVVALHHDCPPSSWLAVGRITDNPVGRN